MKKIILLFLCLIIFNTLLEAKIIYEYKGEKNSIIRNYKLKAISNIGKFKESFTIEGYLVDEDNQPIKNKEVYIYSTLERNGIIAKNRATRSAHGSVLLFVIFSLQAFCQWK